MHAGLKSVALTDSWKGSAARGGENLSGGDAKGTPRNWCTSPSACGSEVDFPTMTPASTVAVGASYPEEESAQVVVAPLSTRRRPTEPNVEDENMSTVLWSYYPWTGMK